MAAQNLAEFNGIVDAIYTGSAETPPWHSFLRLLKETTGSAYACIGFGDEQNWNGRIHYVDIDCRHSSRGLPPPMVDGQDHSDFLRVSPFTLLPQDRVVTADDLARHGSQIHRDYIVQVMRRFGICDVMGVNFARRGGQVANLRLGRARAAGPYSSQDKELCALILPHLRRACAEVSCPTMAPTSQPLLFEILRSLGVGVFLIDAHSRILDASGLSLEILNDHRQLLSASNGCLRLRNRTQQQMFAAAVARALENGERQAVRVAGGDHGKELHLVCLRAPESGVQGPPRRAIVLIGCGQRPRPVAMRMLRDLFGLSSAEAQVALGLIGGLSIGEIAAANSISRNTVYSHLKAAFGKTGVSQQSALVSRMLGSVAVLGGP